MRTRALLLAAFAACAAPRVRPPAPPASQPGPVTPDRDGAAADVSVLARDSYRLLSAGYDSVYLDGLARDPRLILIDVEPDEIQVGFDEHAGLRRRLFDDDLYELWSKHLDVVVSADATVVWTHDDLSYRVIRRARRATVPLRVTAVYERRDGRWVKVLEHVSSAVPEDVAAARAVAITADLPSDVSGGEAGSAVRDLVVASLNEARLSADPDALALGLSPERELRGAAVAGVSVAALAGATRADATELRVDVGHDGEVAWAAAVLACTTPGGVFPARATWVLERREGAWRILQTHVSAPVPDEIIARELFGL